MGSERDRPERTKQRVSPSRQLYGRVGTTGVLLIDVSESGAKIEHYNRRFGTGSKIDLIIEWQERVLNLKCHVVYSRVDRFITGEKGATVYRSGLRFLEPSEEIMTGIRAMVADIVKRGLAEQVANVKGLGPIMQRDMPTFRTGVVDAGGRAEGVRAEGAAHLVPEKAWASEIGYVRCRRVGNWWEKKRTHNSAQPEDGFTVPATEHPDDIELLCRTWDTSDEAGRQFIKACAEMAVTRT